MVTLRLSLILAVIALVAFGASIAGSFHFDDYSLFSDPAVTSASGLWQVWQPARTRPLSYLTFWMNYQVGGRNAVGYHVVNLLLHLTAVLLAFAALQRLMPRKAAFIAAAIFAVHPIQSEAVNYVFARSNLLMAVFCLAALWAWTRGRRWQAVIWYTLALLSKEECVAFPLLLLLLYFSISRNARELKPIGVMLALSVAAGLRVLFAIAVSPGAAAGVRSTVSTATYLGAEGGVILRYLRLLLWPAGLTVDADVSTAAVWWAWVVLAVLVICAARWFTGARAGFWFIAGVILLLPSSSVFTASDLLAERRMYLPMIAFASAIALLLQRWHPAVPAVVCLALAAVSFSRTQTWKDDASLWTDAVDKAPKKLRPRIQLARALPAQQALQQLQAANQIAPDDPSVAQELGRVYIEMNEPGKALAEFGRALAAAPNDARAVTNRGVALMLMRQNDAAKEDFLRALELDPCLFEARLNAIRTGAKPRQAATNCHFSPEQEAALAER